MKSFNTTQSLAAVAILAVTNASFAKTVTTDDGNGADAYVWKGANGNTNYGGGTNLYAQDYSGTSSVAVYVRFDVSGYASGSFTSATLSLTSNEQATIPLGSAAGRGFQIHGLLDGQAGNNWGEGTITYNNAPGLTIGAGVASADIDVTTPKAVLLDNTLVQVDNGLTVDLSNPALLSFLNADTDGLVTFIVTGPVTGASVAFDWASKEHATLAAPTLTFEATAVADTTPPDITTLNPADNATVGVAVGTNLVASFNEEVAIGTGNITIKNLTDNTQSTIAITDGSQVSVAGSVLTINPTADLAGGKSYAIRIDATAIKDSSGNFFAGIADDTTWNFATDVTPPTVATLSPADDATDVAVVDVNLSATFDENIQKGSGNITLKKSSDNSTVETFDAATSPRVTVSGTQLTIDPTSILTGLTGYYVEIDAGAIKDLAGNSFAGISGSGTWSFTTAEIVLFDDFSSDPNISTEWTSYGYWLSPPGNVATWNSTDQDLDLVKLTSGTGGWGVGVFRTGSTRSATDPVTMTVKDFSGSGGSWSFLGLMISAVANPGYITTDDDTYTLALVALGGTDVRYEVRRTYLDGESDFILYQGSSFDLATSAPVTLDIVRNGDHYEFLANDVLLYTTASPAAGDTYDTAAKDSLVNYQIVMAGDRALNATVDDFGVSGATSPYDTWAAAYSPADLSNKAGNNDGDSLTNLQEFAFGTNPTVSTGEIAYSGGTLTTPGAPKIVAADGSYSIVFGRRADYVAAGLTYTVQFSAGLDTWVDNNDGTNPFVQIATDGTINAMSVPFVDFISTPSGMQKPTFARVKVEMAD